MPDQPPPAGDQFVQSLARGLSVIRAFDHDHPEMTLSEVAARVGFSRATARRFLHTLVELDYVRTDGRTFALTPQVLRLGTAYLSGLALPDVAQPHLEQLSATVGESTSAAVLDRDDVVYVARVATRRIMSVGITVGTRFPAYATSMGRVLLAALPTEELETYLAEVTLRPLTPHALADVEALRDELAQVRDRGWAAVDQELEPGLRSIAAPVRNKEGTVVAALNVSASTSSVGVDDLVGAALPALLETAARVGDDLALTRP
ncbi:helix-turn-helix domain-containing protein [Aeromicrobium sp. SMF47]|uniref:IclR family transcriptional regulator domain-containing protein n=1 Tax=Aeromicrobium yanjiei TaxID=2662028 RepID=UPI00129DC863|nr:IclR family transcriptional regulator C-terminal domain-containing protein [Aeromicrobium yanjiei]MRJ78332.1 helix-turn-helix domain-containing protein [Aeromicrobium yanjiei]